MIVITSEGTGTFIEAEEQREGMMVIFNEAGTDDPLTNKWAVIPNLYAKTFYRALSAADIGKAPLDLSSHAAVFFIRELYSAVAPQKNTDPQPPQQKPSNGIDPASGLWGYNLPP